MGFQECTRSRPPIELDTYGTHESYEDSQNSIPGTPFPVITRDLRRQSNPYRCLPQPRRASASVAKSRSPSLESLSHLSRPLHATATPVNGVVVESRHMPSSCQSKTSSSSPNPTSQIQLDQQEDLTKSLLTTILAPASLCTGRCALNVAVLSALLNRPTLTRDAYSSDSLQILMV